MKTGASDVAEESDTDSSSSSSVHSSDTSSSRSGASQGNNQRRTASVKRKIASYSDDSDSASEENSHQGTSKKTLRKCAAMAANKIKCMTDAEDSASTSDSDCSISKHIRTLPTRTAAARAKKLLLDGSEEETESEIDQEHRRRRASRTLPMTCSKFHRCVVESDSDSLSSPESVVTALKRAHNTLSHRPLQECRVVLINICLAGANACLRSPRLDRPLPQTAYQPRSSDSDSDSALETTVSKKRKSDASSVASPTARKTKVLSDSKDTSKSGSECNNCKFSSHYVNDGNRSRDESLDSQFPRLATNSRRCVVESDSDTSSSPKSDVTVLKGTQNILSHRQLQECRVVLTNCLSGANAYLRSPCLDRPLPRTAHQPRSSDSDSDSAFETLVSKKRKSGASSVASPSATKTKELSDSKDTSNSGSKCNNCKFSSHYVNDGNRSRDESLDSQFPRLATNSRRCVVESDSDTSSSPKSVVTVLKGTQNTLSHRQQQECRVVLTNCLAGANAYLRSPCLDTPLPRTAHQPRSSDSDSDSAFETLVSKMRKSDASSVASPSARKTKLISESDDTSNSGSEYNKCKFSSSRERTVKRVKNSSNEDWEDWDTGSRKKLTRRTKICTRNQGKRTLRYDDAENAAQSDKNLNARQSRTTSVSRLTPRERARQFL